MNESHEEPQPQPEILIDPAQMAGVWANWAQVSHSIHEFTIDFVRLESTAPRGIVVARVSVSPLFVTQLIEAYRQGRSTLRRRYRERSRKKMNPTRIDREQIGWQRLERPADATTTDEHPVPEDLVEALLEQVLLAEGARTAPTRIASLPSAIWAQASRRCLPLNAAGH